MHRIVSILCAATTAALLLVSGSGRAFAHGGGCGFWEAVEPGDTLAVIAARCGVPEMTLARLNPGVDPANLQMGSVVTVQPFEAAARPAETEGATGDPVLGSYRATVRGHWREEGASCGTLAGSWTFDDLSVRGNATIFTLAGVFGTTDRLVVETLRATDAEPFPFVVTPGPVGLAVTGPGIAVDLLRCPEGRS